MERGRRIAIAVVALVVMVLTATLIVRLAGDGGDARLATDADGGSVDALTGEVGGDGADGVQPGDPPQAEETPTVPLTLPLVPDPLAEAPTVPDSRVLTIPLPDFGAAMGSPAPGTGNTPAPAFSERGVWVVKTNGTSPILVAGGATAGVAVGGTWVAFVQGDAVTAVRRSDLRTMIPLGSGVSGTAAQGLPIAGGRRGVAFLKGGKAHLVDPADRSVRSVDAANAVAVAAEEDGDGRLLWADGAGGLRVEPSEILPSARVHGGVLAMGHGFLAHLKPDGRLAVRAGAGAEWASLDWGAVDRLHTGAAGLVAASGGRVHLRTPAGQDRVLLERATTPVVAGDRILYVSGSRTVTTASLTGTDVRSVVEAGPGRSITNLDLLDDSTLVVTVT